MESPMCHTYVFSACSHINTYSVGRLMSSFNETFLAFGFPFQLVFNCAFRVILFNVCLVSARIKFICFPFPFTSYIYNPLMTAPIFIHEKPSKRLKLQRLPSVALLSFSLTMPMTRSSSRRWTARNMFKTWLIIAYRWSFFLSLLSFIRLIQVRFLPKTIYWSYMKLKSGLMVWWW